MKVSGKVFVLLSRVNEIISKTRRNGRKKATNFVKSHHFLGGVLLRLVEGSKLDVFRGKSLR